MDINKNYYAILGVLPDAEDIVIRAAYKALVQRYHPDKYAGSKEQADLRMAELNEAFKILSDTTNRAEYDKLHRTKNPESEPYFNEEPEDKSVDPLEQDWNLALEYYPELRQLEQRLHKVSWKLANTYRAYMLETQSFDQGQQVADAMEQKFLVTYYGNNPKIVKFASSLIQAGHKEAARALNKAVKVLGDKADADRVISKIQNDFHLHPNAKPKKADTPKQNYASRQPSYKEEVSNTRNVTPSKPVKQPSNKSKGREKSVNFFGSFLYKIRLLLVAWLFLILLAYLVHILLG